VTDEHITPSATEEQDTLKKYQLGTRILLEGAKAQTGQSPKEVIWTKNKAKLYHYLPTFEQRFPVPILMVYALVNRPYILDLIPGNSLVEYLVSLGFDVYLLDWGTPGDEDAYLSFEHYILDYLPRAVKGMLRRSQAKEFTLLGYCMGGTMSAMYAALFPGIPLRNLVLLTTPINFIPEDMGLYGTWTNAKFLKLDQLVDAFGNVPGEIIDIANRMTRPVTNTVGTYITMWNLIMRGQPMETWLAMNKWVNDIVPFPGEAFRQWIRDFYQQNKLACGELRLRGQLVNLARITCSVLSIAGKKDHICTPPQAAALMNYISSQDKEFLVLNAGHVGLLTGSGAKKDLWPKLGSWLEAHSG
jgi:polyhydroxyalkanoate synthase subunit PhaC